MIKVWQEGGAVSAEQILAYHKHKPDHQFWVVPTDADTAQNQVSATTRVQVQDAPTNFSSDRL
jgi:hypothetical protein